jgi:hypothetical protein
MVHYPKFLLSTGNSCALDAWINHLKVVNLHGSVPVMNGSLLMISSF